MLLFSICTVFVVTLVPFISSCGTPPVLDLNINLVTLTEDSDTSVTVTWATDRPATSQVEYGTSTAYGSTTTETTTRQLAHGVTLDSLTPGTTYHYRVLSVAEDTGSAESADKTFNTTQLEISGVSATTTNHAMTVTWSTDDSATSQVKYGTSAAYGMTTTATSSTSKAHSVTITGLDPETDYHYQVLSTTTTDDAESADNTVTTDDPLTLKIGNTTQPSTDNPFLAVIGAGDATHFQMMYEPLVWVRFDPDAGTQGAIAESWTYDDTTKTWTININPDAKFSDGSAVTAQDVEWTLETMMYNGLGTTVELSPLLVQSAADTADTVVLEIKGNGNAADTIVRTDGGSFITEGYIVGEAVGIAGTEDGPDKGSTGDQDGAYRIASVTADTITLNGVSSLSDWGPLATITATAGGPSQDAVQVVDATTLTMQLHTYSATFMRQLGNAMIVPMAAWSVLTDAEILDLTDDNIDIGSGPYELVSRTLDFATVYTARDDYWGGRPPIDDLQKIYYANEDAQLYAIKLGQIDCVSNFNLPTAIPGLIGDDDIEVYQIADNTTLTFYMNHRIEPWDNVAVRQAVSIGLDRQNLISFAANDWGSIPSLFERYAGLADVQAIIDDIDWEHAGKTHAKRIEDANLALDAIDGMSAIGANTAGVRTWDPTPTAVDSGDEFDMTFKLEVATWDEHNTIGELIDDDFAEMGIIMELIPTNVSTLVGKVFRQKSSASAAGWDTIVWGRPMPVEYDYIATQWSQYEETDPLRLSKRGWIMGWTGTNADLYTSKSDELKAIAEGDSARDVLIADTMKIFAADLPAIPLYNSINPGVYRTDKYTGWIEDNGMLANGAVTAMTAIYNILQLETVD
jgi:ABC-type transport system substrate-binding protein